MSPAAWTRSPPAPFGVPEHDVTGLGDVLVELQAALGSPPQELAKFELAGLQGLGTQVLAIEFQRSKANRKTWGSFRR